MPRIKPTEFVLNYFETADLTEAAIVGTMCERTIRKRQVEAGVRQAPRKRRKATPINETTITQEQPSLTRGNLR